MSEELKANVLVVDDEKQFLDVFSKRLESRGMKVDTAVNGDDAIEKTKGKQFDAIILDLVMPGINGIEILKRIKSENPDMDIILLTGHATVEKGVEAMKAGAMDFLEKPVDIGKVMEKIGEAKRRRLITIDKKTGEHIKEIMESKGW